jgi:hypothetical protein
LSNIWNQSKNYSGELPALARWGVFVFDTRKHLGALLEHPETVNRSGGAW